MIKTYQKIWILLTPHERKKAVLLLFMMVAMALMEVVGVASVFPFLMVLGNPEMIETNHYLAIVNSAFGFEDHHSFLMALGLMTLAILLVTATVRIVTQYALSKFSSMRLHSIAYRLLNMYLYQSYDFFLKRNSSNMSKTLLSEVGEVVNNALTPGLNLLTYLLLTLVIVIFLVIVDPVLALILSGVFGGVYGLMYLTVHRVLGRIGKERKRANGKRFRVASEIFGGIKELKILGREKIYLKAFEESSWIYAKHQVTAQVLSQTPKFLIEVIAFGAILVIALYALRVEGNNLGQLLPVLGLYAMGVMRLKPALDQIYMALSKMRFGAAALDDVIRDLQSLENHEEHSIFKDNFRLPLLKELSFQDVAFSYADTSSPALKNINLTIKANTTVGIIGTTGAGKSTLVDVLLGLLPPQIGMVLIDNEPLGIENIRAWQNSIGYVPQQIFLADDTVAANIAFGVPNDEIDMQAAEQAAKMAQIHEFVATLPKGYATKVGERGVRFSGGQRQRLGIARALYHKPDLLVLDEATSALDNETEAEVMRAIDSMSGQKTIIIIAHRLSTVERCDQLVRLFRGTQSK